MFTGLEPYPAYRVGARWAATLPEHWHLERGKALFIRLTRTVRESDGVVTRFRDGVVTLRSLRRTTGFTEALQEIGYQGVRNGDLVIHAMDAFAGAVGVSDSDGKCSPVYAVCRPRGESEPQYYAALVREMARTGWITALSRGIRERSTDFRFESFANELLPTPPLDEQAAIVRYLAHAHHRIDRAIAAKRRLIALLDEQKQAIINQAVTRGLDPTSPLRYSGDPWLGEIPESWDRVRVKSLISPITQGWSPQCDAQPPASGEWGVLKTGCSNYGVFRPEQSKRLADGLEPRPEHQVRRGDIVMSRASTMALVGSAALVDATPERLMLSDKTYRFRTVNPRVVSEFLVASLQTRSVRAQIESRASGASSSMQNISQDVVRELVISLPPVADQRVILEQTAQALNGATWTTFAATREVELLREFRTRLTSDVVTGQVDVRHIAATLPDLDPDELTADVGGTDDDLSDEAAEFLEDVDA